MGNENYKIQLVFEALNNANLVFNDLKRQLKDTESQSKDSASGLSGFFNEMKENWVAVTAAVAGVAIAANKGFEYMELGAKAEQAETSFRSVAAAAGESADKILEGMKRAANGTMDDSAIMQKAVKGMVQGLSGDQMVKIMEASRNAAKVAGTDIQTAYESITDAIGNEMPRALKQFGLITKEQMALLNKSMAEGITGVDLYTLAMANAADQSKALGAAQTNNVESIQKLKAFWEETKEVIGKAIWAVISGIQSLGKGMIDAVMGLVSGAVAAIFGVFSLAASGLNKLGAMSDEKLAKIQSDYERVKNMSKGFFADAVGATGPKPGSADFVGPVQPGTLLAAAGEVSPTTQASSAKALEDSMKARLALKAQEADIQKEINLAEIAGKEEEFSQVDATRLRLMLTQQLLETQKKNLSSIDTTSQAGPQALANQQKSIDDTKKKISELTISLADQTGTAKVGSEGWIKLQQAMNAYAVAAVNASEKDGALSNTDAIKARIALLKDSISILEIERDKNAIGSAEWLKQQAAIEGVNGAIGDQNKLLADTNRQEQEALINQKLYLEDVAEQARTITKAEATEQRIALNKALLVVQQDTLTTIEALGLKGTSAWSTQVGEIKKTEEELLKLNKQMKELTGTFAEGFKDAFNQYIYDAQTAFQEGVKLAQDTAQAMEQAFSDFFFDMFTGKLKHLSDYINSFFQSVARAMANMMAQKTSVAIASGISNYFGGGGSGSMSNATTGAGDLGGGAPIGHVGGYIMHAGGLIPRFHIGGLASDERPIIAQTGEGILSRKGMAAFDRLNNGDSGSGGSVSVAVTVENKSSQPVTAKTGDVRYDHQAKQFVVGVILSDLEYGGPIRSGISGMRS